MTLLVGVSNTSNRLHLPAEEGDYAPVVWCNLWHWPRYVREATPIEEETLTICPTCIKRKRLGKKKTSTTPAVRP